MPEITVSVVYETIDSPTEMATQLAAALPRGWHGTITALRQDSTDFWALVLTTPANIAPVNVGIGDVLLWDGTTYQSMSAADFAERYGS